MPSIAPSCARCAASTDAGRRAPTGGSGHGSPCRHGHGRRTSPYGRSGEMFARQDRRVDAEGLGQTRPTEQIGQRIAPTKSARPSTTRCAAVPSRWPRNARALARRCQPRLVCGRSPKRASTRPAISLAQIRCLVSNVAPTSRTSRNGRSGQHLRQEIEAGEHDLPGHAIDPLSSIRWPYTPRKRRRIPRNSSLKRHRLAPAKTDHWRHRDTPRRSGRCPCRSPMATRST